MSRRHVALLTLLVAVPAGCHRNEFDAAASTDSTSLYGVEWRLIEMLEQPAPAGAGDRPATLLFSADDRRASGFGGCNRYGGTFTHNGDSIWFSDVVMTRMGCDRGMDLEVRYTGLLESVRRYRLRGGALELIAGDSVVARFVRPTP